MGGIAPAGEQAGVVEHSGRGADGREPAAGGVLPEDESADARIGAEMGDAGAAGQKDAVKNRLAGGMVGDDGGEGGVGMDRDAAAAGDVNALVEGGGDNLDAGAAEQVDRGEGLDFFEAGGEDCQNRGHGVTLSLMSGTAHGNFSERKRLVIFGCGYVGAAMARLAVAHGVRVTALTRNEGKAEALRADGVEEVIVDDLAAKTWHDRIEGAPDYVLNCVSSGGGGTEGYRRSYLEGMGSVVAWLRARGSAGVAIYTGSTSVYPQDGGVTVDEDAATGGEERAQVLLATERLLLDATAAAATAVSGRCGSAGGTPSDAGAGTFLTAEQFHALIDGALSAS